MPIHKQWQLHPFISSFQHYKARDLSPTHFLKQFSYSQCNNKCLAGWKPQVKHLTFYNDNPQLAIGYHNQTHTEHQSRHFDYHNYTHIHIHSSEQPNCVNDNTYLGFAGRLRVLWMSALSDAGASPGASRGEGSVTEHAPLDAGALLAQAWPQLVLLGSHARQHHMQLAPTQD